MSKNPTINISGLLDMLCALTVATGGVQGSLELHRQLLCRLMRVAMPFYEATPLGVILNLVSDDMFTIDMVLHFTLRGMLNIVLELLAAVLVISLITPLVLVSVPVMTVACFLIQVHCTPCVLCLCRFPFEFHKTKITTCDCV